MTFVLGQANVEFLKARYEKLKTNPLFKNMVYTEDWNKVKKWAPLMVDGRNTDAEPCAATFVREGTDVDYGRLTKSLSRAFVALGGHLQVHTRVIDLTQSPETRQWTLKTRQNSLTFSGVQAVKARFVFVGAGGAALPLLQKSGIPEIRGFGGFPISGQFLVCQNPRVVAAHSTKVYGKAAVGAPPMSVPHLDARVIDGKPVLLFGPYAGFSPRFLRSGSLWDLVGSLKWHNLIPMAAAGVQNFDLVTYLGKELLATKEKKFQALQTFVPNARPEDWTLVTAGQRVQIMKKDPKKWGILQFGTEVISSEDKTISGLLGASPGASVSVQIVLDVLAKCFPEKFEREVWQGKIKKMIPSFGLDLSNNPALAQKIMTQNSRVLKISA